MLSKELYRDSGRDGKDSRREKKKTKKTRREKQRGKKGGSEATEWKTVRLQKWVRTMNEAQEKRCSRASGFFLFFFANNREECCRSFAKQCLNKAKK